MHDFFQMMCLFNINNLLKERKIGVSMNSFIQKYNNMPFAIVKNKKFKKIDRYS